MNEFCDDDEDDAYTVNEKDDNDDDDDDEDDEDDDEDEDEDDDEDDITSCINVMRLWQPSAWKVRKNCFLVPRVWLENVMPRQSGHVAAG